MTDNWWFWLAVSTGCFMLWIILDQLDELESRVVSLEPTFISNHKIDWKTEQLENEDRFASKIATAVADAVAAKL